ncbi:hypothetical protein HY008_00380 [Candidatus Woesebacteria bacterium]|nr:hypothetical protein [Candidatus Woesebacteria bacterium]
MDHKAKIAQVLKDIGPPLQGEGPLGTAGANAPTVFENIISITIGLISAVAGIWFIFNVITGALQIIGSEGDKGALENARRKITYGIIGIVVVIGGMFVAQFVGQQLGLNILNPAQFLQNVWR